MSFAFKQSMMWPPSLTQGLFSCMQIASCLAASRHAGFGPCSGVPEAGKLGSLIVDVRVAKGQSKQRREGGLSRETSKSSRMGQTATVLFYVLALHLRVSCCAVHVSDEIFTT